MQTPGTLALATVAVAALCLAALGAALRAGRLARAGREAYLIAPYLDLGAPGERGAPYALSEGCAGLSPRA
jgi:hypothetical protein